MCVLCSIGLRIKGHYPETLKKTVFSVAGPSAIEIEGVTTDDIDLIAPTSLSLGGMDVPRSWYDNPSTDLRANINLTYSFASSSLIQNGSASRVRDFFSAQQTINFEGRANIKEFSEFQKNQVRAMFDDIARLTNISFSENTGSDDNINNAHILLVGGNLIDGIAGVAALPQTGADHGTVAGTIFIDNADTFNFQDRDYARGQALYSTTLHEIGHALGLKHPHDNPNNENSPLLQDGDLKLSKTNSLMSYKDFAVTYYIDIDTGRIKVRQAKSYQHLDVLALQYIYGTRMGSGDTTINTEDLWEKDKNLGGMQEVLSDMGGSDTVIGHSARPNRIHLQSGTFSDIGYGHSLWLGAAQGGDIGTIRYSNTSPILIDADWLYRMYKGEANLILAANSFFEHATGGDVADVLSGNDLNNSLVGGSGRDQLLGARGNDTLEGGKGNDILDGGSGHDILDGGDGDDAVYFSHHTSGVKVSLIKGKASSDDGDTDTLFHVEHIVASPLDDLLIGNDDNNIIVGHAGSNTLIGGRGSDTLSGGGTAIGMSFDHNIKHFSFTDAFAPQTRQGMSSQFGNQILVTENLLILSDPLANEDTGRVYVFSRESSSGEWQLTQELADSQLPKFGTSIAFDHGLLVIGADRDVHANSSTNVDFAFYRLIANGTEPFAEPFERLSYHGSTVSTGEKLDIQYSGSAEDYYFAYKGYSGTSAVIILRRLSLTKDTTQDSNVEISDIFYPIHQDDFTFHSNSLLVTSVTATTAYDLTFAFAESEATNNFTGSRLLNFIYPGYLDQNINSNDPVFQMGRTFHTFDDLMATAAIRIKPDNESSSDIWKTASGMVMVYRNKNEKYTQEALIFDESVSANDKFGADIALIKLNTTELMAVGAPGGDRVYIYGHEGEAGWVLRNTILAPDKNIQNFGSKLAFANDGTLLIPNGQQMFSFGVEEWTAIEDNATDTAPDYLFGGDGDDKLLHAKQSSDVLDGGSGKDAVVFHGYKQDYKLTKYESGMILAERNNITDKLVDIETLMFWDETVDTSSISITPSIKSVPNSYLTTYSSLPSSLTLPITMDKTGNFYGLLTKEGVPNPSKNDIKAQGVTLHIEDTSKEYTLGFKDLSADTAYTIHFYTEDIYGNESAIFVTEQSLTTKPPALLDTPTVTNTAHYIEVTFSLSYQGKVYYAYFNEKPATPPEKTEDLKTDAAVTAGADEYGVMFVDSSYTLQRFYIKPDKPTTNTSTVYMAIENTDTITPIAVPVTTPLVEEQSIAIEGVSFSASDLI